MAVTFPTTLDSFSDKVDNVDDVQAVDINDVQDAIEALEAKVGINSSAVATTIDYLLKSTGSANPGHKHTLANSATDVTATAAEINTVADGSTAKNSHTHTYVQIVNTQTGAVNTGTTALPHDDTIPQITEGTEWMTLAITPTSATNYLRIDVVCVMACAGADFVTAALFKDATASALAANTISISANNPATLIFSHYMAAGTTSSITFRVRGGNHDATTCTLNGVGGARLYGGVLASSITITEIAA